VPPRLASVAGSLEKVLKASASTEPAAPASAVVVESAVASGCVDGSNAEAMYPPMFPPFVCALVDVCSGGSSDETMAEIEVPEGPRFDSGVGWLVRPVVVDSVGACCWGSGLAVVDGLVAVGNALVGATVEAGLASVDDEPCCPGVTVGEAMALTAVRAVGGS
jgi:hypothetical protein